MLNSTALVLEGGGMRGAFTAGVLDYFIEHDVEFPYVIGVSAGATNGISYLSKQRGRNLYADTRLMQERPYIGFKTLLRRGEMIDFDLLFKEFPDSIYPYDWETFAACPSDFEMVTANVITGEPCYFSKPESMARLSLIGMASSSLPFVNRMVVVDGTPMLDGGLVDSIPLARAKSRGYDRALVVLTQLKGYRKSPYRHNLPKFLYPRHPKVIELLNSRAERYNRQVEWIEALESRGEIDVLRPIAPLMVGRLTKNIDDITALHRQGYDVAREWMSRR